MKKRLLATLLVLAVLLACPVQAKTDPEEPVQVKVTVYTYQGELEDIRGLYYDNGFYVTPEVFARLAGAELTASGPKEASFSFFKGIMNYTVELDGSRDMPTLSSDGKLYLSLPHALRGLGFDITFASSADAAVHMAILRPYTVLDGMAEYRTSGDVRFSWSEADGIGKTKRYFSALDTIFFGYDSDIFRYSADALGVGSVEEQVILDVLYMILANGGTQYEQVSDPWLQILNPDPDVINALSATLEMGKYIGARMGDETLQHIAVLDEVLGVSLLDAVGAAAGFTADQFQAAETVKQYFNMAQANGTLLEDSLCLVAKGSADYQEWPELYRAAADAQKMMDGTYPANYTENLFLNLWKSGLSVAAGPPATAWSALMSVLKYDPLTQGVVEKEKAVAYADVSADIQIIANNMAGQTFSRLIGQTDPSKRVLTEVQQQLKAQLILSLKASLTARERLLESTWLKQDAALEMGVRCQHTAALLQRIMNAELLITDQKPVVKEDLTWIAELAIGGGFGYVVSYRGDVYYWRYNEQSFDPEGTSNAQPIKWNVKNQMVRRAPDGTEKVLFEAQGYGEFAVANGRVFYHGPGGLRACGLDGKDEITLSTKTPSSPGQATSDTSYLFYQLDDSIAVIDTARETLETLALNATLIICWDGVVYYQPRESDSSAAVHGQMTVARILPDGTEQAVLHTTAPDLYDKYVPGSPAAVGQMYFAKDDIYFSYGSVSGSGIFFQGGKIIRMGYDGSNARVAAGEQALVMADFIVESDGSVTAEPQIGEYKPLWNTNPEFKHLNGVVFRYDRTSGVPVKLLEPADYAAAGPGLAGITTGENVLIDFAQEVDGKLYYLAHSRTWDSMATWHSGYTRVSSALMAKDLKTGKVETLYTF